MNIEEIAVRFMGNMLANPLIDQVQIPDGEILEEVLAHKAIKAAHVLKQELKADFMGAEDAMIVE